LTLYTTPVIYIWFDRLAQRISPRRETGKIPAGAEPVPAG
jgi:multidrug efflux pump